MPSQSANSIHVINQCLGLAKKNFKVILYILSSKININESEIKKFYGIKSKKIKIKYFYNFIPFAKNLQINFLFLFNIYSINKNDLIISRNLYASFFLSKILRYQSIYETHQVEKGIRGLLQKMILNSSLIKTIVISNILKEILSSHHKIILKNCYVLHDAAPENIKSFNYQKKDFYIRKMLKINLNNYEFTCGYFGQINKGRGIEIIISLANLLPNYCFLIFGGEKKEIENLRKKNQLKNLKYMGYYKNHESRKIMKCLDALLMPYQNKVFVGKRGLDTSKWMSPMKMFEYLASGVPILSSNLPVLKEILKDKVNCLLVNPSDPNDWKENLELLKNNPGIGERISKNAFIQYKNNHTWKQRANKILNLR
tara:strand:- start:49 stop:1158 length:1110 start_codon:yes stop_codon:yes gene_type:complete